MASIIGSLFQLLPLARSAKNLVVPSGKTRIGDIVIDATLNEVIDYSSTITEHPVENKSSISDHIFKKPLKLKIEGYITDSPIRLMGLFETPLQSNSLNSLISNIKTSLPFYSSQRPSSQGYFALKSIYEDRSLITVVTKFESFADMAIESLSFNSDEDTGGRLSFSAELRQIIYAKVTNSINVNVKNVNLQRITSPVASAGIIPNQVEKTKSWLASGADGIAGLF
jgi:hypothetical protein